MQAAGKAQTTALAPALHIAAIRKPELRPGQGTCSRRGLFCVQRVAGGAGEQLGPGALVLASRGQGPLHAPGGQAPAAPPRGASSPGAPRSLHGLTTRI